MADIFGSAIISLVKWYRDFGAQNSKGIPLFDATRKNICRSLSVYPMDDLDFSAFYLVEVSFGVGMEAISYHGHVCIRSNV